MIMCLYNNIWRSNQRLSLLYPRAFIIVINSLDSPDNMLTNNALYPWGTSVGKDKPLCSAAVRTARVHNSNRSPVQSSNTKGMQSCSMSLSSNYIWSGFLSDLLCAEGDSTCYSTWHQAHILTIIFVWALGMAVDLIWHSMGSPTRVSNSNMCGELLIKI